MSKLKAVGTNVVVQLLKIDERAEGGIYIPSTATYEGIVEAKVVSSGPEQFEEGNIVLAKKDQGAACQFNGEEYWVFDEKSILAVVK